MSARAGDVENPTEVPSEARAIFKAWHCDRLGPDTKREILGKWYLVLGSSPSDTFFFCDFRPDGSALCDDERKQHRDEIQPDVIVIRNRDRTITGWVVRRTGKYYVPSRELLLAPLV